MKTNAIPVLLGRCFKSSETASKPPAEAPMPTTREGASGSGVAGASLRSVVSELLLIFRRVYPAELIGRIETLMYREIRPYVNLRASGTCCQPVPTQLTPELRLSSKLARRRPRTTGERSVGIGESCSGTA